MKWRCSKLRSKYLICLFSLSALVLCGESPHLTVEDFYGEWTLDSVIRTGWSSSFSEETILERFNYHILIGEFSYFTDDDQSLYEDLQWRIDTLSYEGGDCTFFTLASNNLISREMPMIRLEAFKFGMPQPWSFDISLRDLLASYYDGWFLFYKKVETDRLTDYTNPYLHHLFGVWEPYEFQYFKDYFMTYDKFQSIYSNPIEFNGFLFTDHAGKVHDVVYEITTLPSDASPICLWSFKDSVRESLGTIAEFTIFSKKGYVLDRFELSESGVLGDITTSGSILYRKQPPPPLKKQGAQP